MLSCIYALFKMQKSTGCNAIVFFVVRLESWHIEFSCQWYLWGCKFDVSFAELGSFITVFPLHLFVCILAFGWTLFYFIISYLFRQLVTFCPENVGSISHNHSFDSKRVHKRNVAAQLLCIGLLCCVVSWYLTNAANSSSQNNWFLIALLTQDLLSVACMLLPVR